MSLAKQRATIRGGPGFFVAGGALLRNGVTDW